MKYVKNILILVVLLFSIIYTFDLSYLIKGVRVVYLNGYSTVFIDDNKYFDTVKVQTSNNPELWAEHINYNNEKTTVNRIMGRIKHSCSQKPMHNLPKS